MANVSYTETVKTFTTYLYRTGIRQKPFLAPMELPYTRIGCVTLTKRDSLSTAFRPVVEFGAQSLAIAASTSYVRNAVMRPIGETALASLAYSRAYNKLLSKTGERASLLTALAERTSTYTMVLNRLNQLYKGAKALRKGRFREFLHTFGLKPKEKHKHTRWARPRDFSALWLEYWFGWAPTVGDISNAIEVWQAPVDSAKVKIRVGSGNRHVSERTERSTSTTYSDHTIGGKYILQLRCKVEITNPDLWMANQMGFLNPVRTFWETTPFSWFADWFTNVGQVLGSFTDTLGIAITDLWMTRFFTGQTRTDWRHKTTGDYGFIGQHVNYVNRQKLTSLPRPPFILRIPNISWTRGLTLSSLLVTLFSPAAQKSGR